MSMSDRQFGMVTDLITKAGIPGVILLVVFWYGGSELKGYLQDLRFEKKMMLEHRLNTEKIKLEIFQSTAASISESLENQAESVENIEEYLKSQNTPLQHGEPIHP